MFKKWLLILILLIIIPVSFADDNQTNETVSNADLNPVSVDYYFNSSLDGDGDGSFENPYNRITTTRLKSSSTIHLADGEYTLSSSKSLSNVEIIGESTDKTILRYGGSANSGRLSLGIDTYLTLTNITLIAFNIDVEGGILQANNTIFKNAIAFTTVSSATDIVNSASNSFGGAIYAYSYQNYYNSYLPTVILNNCTFINNTAEYGGSIYIDEGTLDIVNSTFIDNYAYNYAGAIAAIGASAKIKNTKFTNDYSINDAGGGIYIYKSTLSGNNLTFINCSATFGSAITSLNSTTALTYINAINNTAKYAGGVIYQIYNALSVDSSNFANNKAQNGSGIYSDSVEILTLKYNNFTNNSVYVMFMPSIFENKSNYYENCDLYINKELILTIGDGNYTLVYNNNSSFEVIPSKYDLRDYNLVTPVKDQQSGGNCWAFAAIAALESAILKATGQSFDLSEENMKNIMQLYSDYGWSGIETNDGGYDEMSIGYLTSWLGPVSGEIEEYDDYSMLSPVLKSIFHIQNIVYLSRQNYLDNNQIKEAILKYGAVSTGIYFDSSYYSSSKHSYYYYASGYSNHAVAIVGWDDNYSANNFNYRPNGDGAWIVKNSWGKSWGDGGYFYVSYYDTRLAQVGVSDYSFAFDFSDTQKFDKNYQYDIIGKTDYLITSTNTIWVQNIFTATDNELLAAVSTYFRKTTSWELQIYVNDELAYTQNASSNPGYVTINLNQQIPITLGDIFKIVFKLTNTNGVEFPISEKVSANQLSYKANISYFSFDGVNWIDLYNYTAETDEDEGHYYSSQVAAIKAFTILYELEPTIELSINNTFNNAQITAIVYDQYNNLIHSGEIVFEINNFNQTIKIENASANINYTFPEINTYDIKAYYLNKMENKTINITRLDISLNAQIVKYKNNITIEITSLVNVSAKLNISVNAEEYDVNLSNSKTILNLYDLDFGHYDVDINVADNIYAGFLNTSFDIDVIKTYIVAGDMISYYNANINYSIYLKDVLGNAVVNKMISFIVDSKSYVATTDGEGKAFVSFKLYKTSTYKMDILFFGDENYFASSKTSNIDVKSTVILPDNYNYLKNSNFNVKLLNQNGEVLSKSQANMIINNTNYWIISNNDGFISKILNLNLGIYRISVFNIETGEVVSKIINVVQPIMNNQDITMFYSSNKYYQIKLFNADGTSNGVVQININGKNYDIKTDSNGYAKFKINLYPKTYVLTASYNGFSVKNKVVVKNLLSAKNISKKKASKIKFKAKLVNNKGIVVKNIKLTFKIKGKSYKIKTNKKGIATLTLKNLKIGKYGITTKYQKLSIKNTIWIRR